MQNRFASLLIAALLPLILFEWFLPVTHGQLDMWLMWAVAMLCVGLPLLYAEIGLALRSQMAPVQGMQTLTRQADTSVAWRSFAWLTLLLALVMASLGIDAASTQFLNALDTFGLHIDIAPFAVALGLMVIAGILSLLGGVNLMVAVVLVAIAFAINAVTYLNELVLTITQATFAEWARAVMLALVSVGVGTGLYWYNSPYINTTGSVSVDKKSSIRKAATKVVFPIWVTQLVVGSIVLLFAAPEQLPISTIIYTLGIIAASAYLIHYASTQLATRFSRFGIWIATLISIVLTLIMVAVSTPLILKVIMMGVSLFGALMLAIFVGWQMKISHMRKSLNFKSEMRYNIWRIAIRIVAPLIILSAIVGWLIT